MLKILVVDDDEDLLEMIGLMLGMNGMKVEKLADCRKTEETIKINPPDIVLMDIFLKHDDGREICSRLKQIPAYAPIPILLYTASDLKRESIMDCGANDFIYKPFEMEVLLTRIKSLTSAKASILKD